MARAQRTPGPGGTGAQPAPGDPVNASAYSEKEDRAVRPIGADQLLIDGIHLEADVGLSPHEQGILQPLEVDLVIHCRPPTGSRPSIDYRVLKDELRTHLLGARFPLIESVAEEVARRVLSRDGAEQVTVTVHKPGALTGARGVAARITRGRA